MDHERQAGREHWTKKDFSSQRHASQPFQRPRGETPPVQTSVPTGSHLQYSNKPRRPIKTPQTPRLHASPITFLPVSRGITPSYSIARLSRYPGP